MRALFYKQIALVCHPATPMFMLFGIMLLIPSYPYTVAFFYVMLGIFFTMLNAREQKDIFFTALLPVRKRDVVRVNLLFAMLLELISVVIAGCVIPLAHRINPAGNPVGFDASLALLGFAFILFALFNGVFFPVFYKTAYRVGTSFLLAVIPAALVMVAGEVQTHIPAFAWLDGAYDPRHLAVLAAGLLLWAAGGWLAGRAACASYEKVDL